MKTETEKELDTFCAEKVMGWKHAATCGEFVAGTFLFQADRSVMAHDSPGRNFSPTTNPADAMAVLERCHDLLSGGIKTKHHKDGSWTVSKFEDLDPIWAKSETLETAICQFAKQLFSK